MPVKFQEACKIQGIGKKMADKVMEIMESGHLRKIDHLGEAVPVLEMFTNIWGAGAKTAQLWYTQVRWIDCHTVSLSVCVCLSFSLSDFACNTAMTV